MNSDMQKMEKNLLDLTRSPTYVAKQSGSWFDASTWAGGRIPEEGAKVSIGKGLTVRYDQQSETRIDTLGVDGNLKFATDKDTKLLVKNFVVTPEGDLEIGTKGDPVKAGVKAEIVITDDGTLDAAQLGRGLVSAGSVEIYGDAKTSHLKVARDPLKGQNTLTLEKAPTNWRVGDRIILTGTQLSADLDGAKWDAQVQDEEVSIQSISGNTITLDRPLAFDHTTPRGDLKAYVANQSRNVVIASENAGTRTDKSQRGHVMFMHSNDVDVRYAEFKDLGRTNKLIPTDDFQKTNETYAKFIKDSSGNRIVGDRKNIEGRYSVHLHKAGTEGQPAVLVGNSIEGSPGWGMTIHDSSAIAESNVTYDIAGAAFITESGNETGAFRNNIAINTGPGLDDYIEKRGTYVHDFGRTGVGFWLQGRLFENEGNVAASARNVGMFYFHRGVDIISPKISDLPVQAVSDTKGDGTVQVDDPPIQNFKNNEVLASGQGLKIIKDFPQQHSDLRTKLDGFKAWEVETGAEGQYTSHYILKDFDLIGAQKKSPETLWKNQGLFIQRNTQDFVFDNMTIDGFANGIGFRPGDDGPKPPDNTQLVWVDLEMKNNGSDFNGTLDPSKSKWLTRDQLENKPLSFQISADSDFFVEGDDTDGIYAEIKGTKSDSLGDIEMPFGDETLAFNYQGAARLANQGYYTLPDGSRAAKFDHYFSDRLTGETIKVPVLLKFKEDWWFKDAPNLGQLDPNGSNMQPEKVTLPTSRFGLDLDEIAPSQPVAPTQPESTAAAFASAGSLLFSDDTLQPVAVYNFEDASGGSAEDSSALGRDNRGELRNGVVWAEGVKGGGLKLDGTGSLNIPDSADINTEAYEQRSLSIWFKPDDLPADQKQVIFEAGGTDQGFNAYTDGDRLYIGAWGAEEATWVSTGAVKADEWQHLAMVIDSNVSAQPATIRAYIDGTEIDVGAVGLLGPHEELSLGAVAGSTRFHDGPSQGNQGLIGSIDEAQVFNQALTGEQVETLAT